LRLRRLIPRYSLRTLVVFLLLVTSGMGLWWRWEPWVQGCYLGYRGPSPHSIQFSGDSKRLAVVACIDTRTAEGEGEGDPDSWAGYDFRPNAERLMKRTVFDVLKGREVGSETWWEKPADAGRFPFDPKAKVSADGSREVAFVGDAEFRKTVVRDLRTGKELAVLGFFVPPPYRGGFSGPGMDGVIQGAFSSDGRFLAVTPGTSVHLHRRRRPEWWWGVFYLWEFWLTAAFAGLFLWSVITDRRRLAPER